MKKRLLSFALFICILSLGFIGLYKIFSWKDTSGDYFSSFKEVENLPKDSVDVMLVGSSRAYCSFNPAVIWDEAGIPSFTVSISGMAQTSGFYSLIEALKKQSPKVVVMEGSLLYTDIYNDLGNKYRNTIVMSPSINNYLLIKDTVEDNEMWDYLLRWPIIHSRYKEIRKNDFELSRIDEYRLGYENAYIVEPQEIDLSIYSIEESVEITESTREWVDKLYSESKKRGFELIFCLAPQNMQILSLMQYKGACDYLDELGIKHIELIDYLDEIGIDTSVDFSDGGHLNDHGGKKTSIWIAGFLKDNFSLSDHRGEKLYERWDMCSDYYRHEVIDHELQGALDNTDTLYSEALQHDNMIVIRSDSDSISIYIDRILVYSEDSVSPEFIYKINSSDFLYVRSDRINDALVNAVYIGQKMYIVPEDMKKTVLVYDLITDRVVAYLNEEMGGEE